MNFPDFARRLIKSKYNFNRGKGKRYTEEFKREAVKQVVERGYSISEVADR
jgi:transposase-like protein